MTGTAPSAPATGCTACPTPTTVAAVAVPGRDGPVRVLVTGSRDWADETAVRTALHQAWTEHGSGRDTVLVSGACPTGADAIAEQYWDRVLGLPTERHPADWSRGRRAGPERNAHLVALGAHVCVAFIGSCSSPRCDHTDVHPSHGATGCAALAETAGITTHRIHPTT